MAYRKDYFDKFIGLLKATGNLKKEIQKFKREEIKLEDRKLKLVGKPRKLE